MFTDFGKSFVEQFGSAVSGLDCASVIVRSLCSHGRARV